MRFTGGLTCSLGLLSRRAESVQALLDTRRKRRLADIFSDNPSDCDKNNEQSLEPQAEKRRRFETTAKEDSPVQTFREWGQAAITVPGLAHLLGSLEEGIWASFLATEVSYSV
ncbi:unnamed protein product [Protopolystoma xenopodis]|uniref:Uncharacterized protein n=1 Tax=Protopolystoma xenopodis TaxID=117903 RepID=A0A3S5B9L3_9PLAT|nr:unnamed protein product [Protopolystoma xenopodis]